MGLKIIILNTETMCIRGIQQDLILKSGQHIRQCKQYKYLSQKITNDGTLHQAIRGRNIQGRKVISPLSGIVWEQNITKTNKVYIMLTYSAKYCTYYVYVRQVKEIMKKILKAAEMVYW